jgi:hypothetical protein
VSVEGKDRNQDWQAELDAPETDEAAKHGDCRTCERGGKRAARTNLQISLTTLAMAAMSHLSFVHTTNLADFQVEFGAGRCRGPCGLPRLAAPEAPGQARQESHGANGLWISNSNGTLTCDVCRWPIACAISRLTRSGLRCLELAQFGYGPMA